MNTEPNPAPLFSAPRLLVFYALFVVYGSLVPLDFRPQPFAQAWATFQELRWFHIGTERRADLVANLILYLPLGLLAAAALSRLHFLFNLLVAFVACALLAVGVEFAQIFFPPRTVSRNDLLVELIGSAIGVVGWLFLRKPIGRFKRLHLDSGAFTLALALYAASYLFLSFFPFDLVLTRPELRAKLDSGAGGLLFAGADCNSLRCLLKLVGEAAAAFPLGVLLLRLRPKIKLLGLIALALIVSVVIELAQIFLLSGVSQGASVLTRVLGVAAGAQFAHGISRQAVLQARAWVPVAVLPYLALLFAANGWWTRDWLPLDAAAARLTGVHFMPFYYHYFVSEMVAMESLLLTTALYLPLGAMLCLWNRVPYHGAVGAALLGALLALVAESGKLFLNTTHADPTNILIAAAGSALGWWFIAWAARPLRPKPPSRTTEARDVAGPSASIAIGASTTSTRPLRLVFLSIIAASLAIALWWTFPIGRAAIAIGLALYAVLLWRVPHAWLWVVPAVLPWLDFAPWSGRLLFDEFDMVLLVTLSVGYLHRSEGRAFALDGWARWALGLTLISYLASLALALFPLEPFDANAQANYHSAYFGLRIAKGFLLALALLPLIKRGVAAGHDIVKHLAAGVAAGMLAVAAVVLWERQVFVGLTNTTSDFRVTGMFSTMHTGGADLDGYLVWALPFIAYAAISVKSFLGKLLGFAIFALGCYALAVTFSRAPVIGFAAAMLVWVLAVFRKRRAGGRLAIGVASIAFAVAVMLPFLQGGFFKARWNASQTDLQQRLNHWKAALSTMPDTLKNQMFGAGLGRYPEQYYWSHMDNPVGNFRIENDGGNQHIRIIGGRAVYIEQFMALRPGAHLLAFDARNSGSTQVRLRTPICEKSLLYSFTCHPMEFWIPPDGKWHHYTRRFEPEGFATGPFWNRRPVKLSIYTNQPGVYVDVDNLFLESPQGRDLLKNGSFSAGLDRWHFSADDHLPWHVDSLPLGIFYDQGWFGILAFAMFTLLILTKLGRESSRDPAAATLLASLIGFLVVGLFNSLFDTPRLVFLFYVLGMVALTQTRNRGSLA